MRMKSTTMNDGLDFMRVPTVNVRPVMPRYDGEYIYDAGDYKVLCYYRINDYGNADERPSVELVCAEISIGGQFSEVPISVFSGAVLGSIEDDLCDHVQEQDNEHRFGGDL